MNNSINLYLLSPNAGERILSSRMKNEENSMGHGRVSDYLSGDFSLCLFLE